MAEPGPVANPQKVNADVDQILSSPDFAGMKEYWYTPIVQIITDPVGSLMAAFDWVLSYVAVGSSNPWVALAIGLGFLVFVAVGVFLLTRSVGRDAGAPVHVDLSPTGRTAEELDADADSMLRTGDYEGAVRSYFSALLLRLGKRDILQLRAGRTTGEYRNELSQSKPTAAKPFAELTEVFDRVWFGGHGATAQDATDVKQLGIDVLSALDGGEK